VNDGGGAGDQQHVGCQLRQPLQRDLLRSVSPSGAVTAVAELVGK
jgi:hypothetical protein